MQSVIKTLVNADLYCFEPLMLHLLYTCCYRAPHYLQIMYQPTLETPTKANNKQRATSQEA